MPGNSRNELSLPLAGGVMFILSLIAILVELCLAAMIGLKSWSQMVYLVLSLALLGYGAGTVCFRLVDQWEGLPSPRRMMAVYMALLGLILFVCAEMLPVIALELTLLASVAGISKLVLVAVILALPFALVGFVLTQLLSLHHRRAGLLYGLDLVGAGCGAVTFFLVIQTCGPWKGLIDCSALLLMVAALVVEHRERRHHLIRLLLVSGGLILGNTASYAEPEYVVDRAIGWEWVPGFVGPDGYRQFLKKWTPLGRTDLYEIRAPAPLKDVLRGNTGTFQINVQPAPLFRYFVNNFRSGTPVYELSEEGLHRKSSRVMLFSQPMEFPYVLVKNPEVYIIGTGGGRDVFMALTHGARRVTGAELNPATWQAMEAGGVVHEYSGGLYTRPGVTVRNIEGRHFTKLQKSDAFDLVVLNGVDTFSALASGAYAYSENYLYTKEALLDFLRVSRPDGIVNLNRIFEGEIPRESLRLFVMALDALHTLGIEKPWEHVLLSRHSCWGMLAIRKKPFTIEEKASVLRYIATHDMDLLFAELADLEGIKNLPEVPINPCGATGRRLEEVNAFFRYVHALKNGKGSQFIRNYPSDLSVVTDDSPFFYKHYRFSLSRELLFDGYGKRCATAFCVQFTIMTVSTLLSIGMIILPLGLLSKEAAWHVCLCDRLIPASYFMGIGLGFMFLEIGMMQKLTLLLESPIYSISVTLTFLLVFSGVGSYLAEASGKPRQWILRSAIGILLLVLFVCFMGNWMIDRVIAFPFWMRVLVTGTLLLPLGIFMGGFMPVGLKALGPAGPSAVAWALGINFCFSVAGSILTIIVAQFLGFRVVFLMASALYLYAAAAMGWSFQPSKLSCNQPA